MLRRTRASRADTTEPARRLSDELGLLERIHSSGGEICFGAPTRCPECGAVGIVDRITHGVQHNSCLRCGETWSFSAKSVSLFEDARPPADQPEVVGFGLLVADLDSSGDWARVTRERFVGMHRAFDPGHPDDGRR